MATMSTSSPQKITPFLWYDNNAHEAIQFYTSVFKNSKIVNLHPLVSRFELEGMQFMAINAGPMFKFTEAVSFFVSCDSQEEIDYFWNSFTKDGQESMCGWLKDKYGLSWQIVPSVLGNLMSGGTPEQSQRVMQAIMQMKKLDVAVLQAAFNGE